MPNLFGLNIAAIVAQSIAGAGGVRPGVLTKTAAGARTVGSLTAGATPVLTTFTFQGFVETKAERRSGQVSAASMPIVTLLGASISGGAIPEVNDSVLIDGASYILTELLTSDPAAAVYEFKAE